VADRHDYFSDTDPQAYAVWLDLQRKMTTEQKIRKVFELSDVIRRLQEAAERKRYPDASDREIFLRVAARRLDRETMLRIYGWDPRA
jgi:hypothetical protein